MSVPLANQQTTYQEYRRSPFNDQDEANFGLTSPLPPAPNNNNNNEVRMPGPRYQEINFTDTNGRTQSVWITAPENPYSSYYTPGDSGGPLSTEADTSSSTASTSDSWLTRAWYDFWGFFNQLFC